LKRGSRGDAEDAEGAEEGRREERAETIYRAINKRSFFLSITGCFTENYYFKHIIINLRICQAKTGNFVNISILKSGLRLLKKNEGLI